MSRVEQKINRSDVSTSYQDSEEKKMITARLAVGSSLWRELWTPRHCIANQSGYTILEDQAAASCTYSVHGAVAVLTSSSNTHMYTGNIQYSYFVYFMVRGLSGERLFFFLFFFLLSSASVIKFPIGGHLGTNLGLGSKMGVSTHAYV